MVYVNAYDFICSLGNDKESIAASLHNTQQCFLTEDNSYLTNNLSSYFGKINCNLDKLEGIYARHNSRNNRLLAYLASRNMELIEHYKTQYGTDRIAVIMGTSTSGLDEAYSYVKNKKESVEDNNYHYFMQELGDPSRFLQLYLGLSGIAYTISTACSSSARSIISGAKLILNNMCDVAIVGGADTLCKMPINGFNSMGLLSYKPCCPFDEKRDGINIGEGAGLIILSRHESHLKLTGTGQSSDAYHLSSPHIDGVGAKKAIEMALSEAKVQAQDIGYICAHGTATKVNDEIESKVYYDLFKDEVRVSSIKHMTGHTLGAAGVIGACVSLLLLDKDLCLPSHMQSDFCRDPSLAPIDIVQSRVKLEKKRILSNAFAFGGNNASLIFEGDM
ncbi:3-oxoacyl-[acyl-carrier-protein] synthase 2 [Anaerobiospirillum thomasii]|uniref:3-oxoacyl-[acyl-carrier-protein] synthase 2 n=1 Tax=Anaerobiospirillum thomasii TaxID=179995 RepID=A0A2X0WRD3_9GAMM|nr:beta-ketoacyl-ACP synthase [Anaerobiospirillum thomasii]SPT69132.1 3-oxoacyl-[acyl-carrier-protein] synthase 2 [Anaerobiospirillum thomasii]SPT72316.1 3-oxoacyl-[acyl-carrier-protein] synthase 2 [Anaerobiospirillum thomasii]